MILAPEQARQRRGGSQLDSAEPRAVPFTDVTYNSFFIVIITHLSTEELRGSHK